jgi:cell wall-associated NlpC family hydrolase
VTSPTAIRHAHEPLAFDRRALLATAALLCLALLVLASPAAPGRPHGSSPTDPVAASPADAWRPAPALGANGYGMAGSATAMAVDTHTAGNAAAYALTRLGTRYLWGGTGRGGLDCSGLTQWAYAHAGIALPRTTWEQYAAGIPVARSHLRRGDLVFMYHRSHMGMYLGHGRWVQASSSHAHVIVQRLPTRAQGYAGAVRPVMLGAPYRD